MTADQFAAVNMVAQLRSRGVRFTKTGPETEHLTDMERLSVQRRLSELGRCLTAALAACCMLSCASTNWGNVLEDFTRGAASARTAKKIMIFGGRGHDTYLGCLSCSKFDSESVFNEMGDTVRR